ncbi:hypothetical protein HDV05_002123, partial [Chytridiales sp. JEL 0842]
MNGELALKKNMKISHPFFTAVLLASVTPLVMGYAVSEKSATVNTLAPRANGKLLGVSVYYSDDRMQFCSHQFYYPQWESQPAPHSADLLGQTVKNICGYDGPTCYQKINYISNPNFYDDRVEIQEAVYMGYDARDLLVEALKIAWWNEFNDPRSGDCWTSEDSWTALSYPRTTRVVLFDCDWQDANKEMHGCNSQSWIQVDLKTRNMRNYWLCKNPDVIDIMAQIGGAFPLAGTIASAFKMWCQASLGDQRVDCSPFSNNYRGQMSDIP